MSRFESVFANPLTFPKSRILFVLALYANDDE